MHWLKQSTAASVVVGPFLSISDGYTSKESFTSLSGIMYKGSAAASKLVTPVSASHSASGYYRVPLASGSSDTVGPLRLVFSNSACHLPVWEDYTVMVANTYDSLVSGTDRIAASLGASGISASTFGASAINSTVIAATGATKIADHVLKREWGDAASSVDLGAGVFRSLLGGVAKLVNKIDITSGSLITYKADDTTAFGTQSVTACAAASPIVTLDTQ